MGTISKNPRLLKLAMEVNFLKPLMGPRATKFWTPPTPSYSEHGREEAVIINDNNHKCKGEEVAYWRKPK